MVITTDSERAQLILVGAFVLATTLIGLSIVLSAGNYTSSLAGEGGTVSQGDDAITAREAFRADMQSYLAIVNPRDTSYPMKKSSIRDVSALVADRVGEFHARQGRVVTSGSLSFESGTRIKQVSHETFREPGERDAGDSPSPTWDLTSGGAVRNMTFYFSNLPLASQDPFTIQFRQTPFTSGNEWNINVKSGSGDWEIEVERPSGSPAYTCERPTTPTETKTMDISNAEMDGTYCRALDQLEMDSTDYKVIVKTPNPTSTSRRQARGKFWVIATDSALGSSPPDAVETDTDVVYSTTVPFSYRSGSVDFESDITVSPGEIE